MASRSIKKFNYGTESQMVAVGVLTSAWNVVEVGMCTILWRLLGVSWPDATEIFQSLSNTKRFALIKALARSKLDNPASEAISEFVRYAAICNGNRNLIAHSWITSETNQTIRAMKIRDKDKKYTTYKFSLQQLRKAATDTEATQALGLHLDFYLASDPINGSTDRVAKFGSGQDVRTALPSQGMYPEPVSLVQPPRKKSQSSPPPRKSSPK